MGPGETESFLSSIPWPPLHFRERYVQGTRIGVGTLLLRVTQCATPNTEISLKGWTGSMQLRLKATMGLCISLSLITYPTPPPYAILGTCTLRLFVERD